MQASYKLGTLFSKSLQLILSISNFKSLEMVNCKQLLFKKRLIINLLLCLLYQGKLHSTYECEILSRNQVTMIDPRLDYAAIKILRCILMRDKEPVKWELLIQHDAQLENRAADPRTSPIREHVTDFILNKCQLGNSFDAGTIETVLGIMATNEFTLQLHDYHR